VVVEQGHGRLLRQASEQLLLGALAGEHGSAEECSSAPAAAGPTACCHTAGSDADEAAPLLLPVLLPSTFCQPAAPSGSSGGHRQHQHQQASAGLDLNQLVAALQQQQGWQPESGPGAAASALSDGGRRAGSMASAGAAAAAAATASCAQESALYRPMTRMCLLSVKVGLQQRLAPA
jgi:hypothetical protein